MAEPTPLPIHDLGHVRLVDRVALSHVERLAEYAAELAAVIFAEYGDEDVLVRAAQDIAALIGEAHPGGAYEDDDDDG